MTKNDSNNSNIERKLAEVRQALKKEIILRSYRENHEELFTLASGKKSPYYFDLKQTLLHPGNLRLASQGILYMMLQLLPEMPRAVSGLTMGADPLTYSISLLSLDSGANIYPLVIRKTTKDHGSGKRVEGIMSEVPEGSKVVLLDDVVTTGGSTLEAYNALGTFGIRPADAFCIVDRMEGGRGLLDSHGVRLHSMFDLDDFAEK